MKKHIIIKADTNDGDYITSNNPITDEQVELIKHVVEAIKNFKPYQVNCQGMTLTHRHNFPYGDCLRKDLGEESVQELYGHLDGFKTFIFFIPYAEYGIHSIKSVDILEIANETKLM